MMRVVSTLALAVACSLWACAGLAVTVTAPQIVGQTPHDPAAFTQGLFLHEGTFFESTGLLGQSTLRQVQPASGEVLRQLELADDQFGEGITLAFDTIWMLTWKNQVAHRFALGDFSLQHSVSYEGEGWGLCFDGTRLVMSDGSSSLQFRDPQSFELLERIDVTRDGVAVTQLNELECALGFVYANVWHSDLVVQIDPNSGQVASQIDCSALRTEAGAPKADVLNGIAYDAQSGHFFLTGKNWPTLFEVNFAPESLAPRGGDAGAHDTPIGQPAGGCSLAERRDGTDAGSMLFNGVPIGSSVTCFAPLFGLVVALRARRRARGPTL